MGRAQFDFSGLTPEERLDLVEQIWDGLAEQPERVPLTTAQKAELDRRLEDMARDGGDGIPWEDVLRQIRARAR
ncbi:MAG: addiction module protein [Acidobacteria bacterium]|nr:addiction module protein [Acidobacteriota bacterium]